MRVHAIQTGLVRIKASQILGRGHGLARQVAPLFDSAWSDWLPTFAYAIEHRNGVILVDTGASADFRSLPRWHPYFRSAVRFDIEPEQEAAPQLKAIGIGASDVKRVVLTHLHIDHDGGLAGFPASEILVSPGELKRASELQVRCSAICPIAGRRASTRSRSFSITALTGRFRNRSASRPTAPSSPSPREATRPTISRSSSTMATSLSSSPATPHTPKRRCWQVRSMASVRTRALPHPRSPRSAPSPPRGRRSICQRTILMRSDGSRSAGSHRS
jgi:Metallo-beta-lactamase superfamily